MHMKNKHEAYVNCPAYVIIRLEARLRPNTGFTLRGDLAI